MEDFRKSDCGDHRSETDQYDYQVNFSSLPNIVK